MHVETHVVFTGFLLTYIFKVSKLAWRAHVLITNLKLFQNLLIGCNYSDFTIAKKNLVSPLFHEEFTSGLSRIGLIFYLCIIVVQCVIVDKQMGDNAPRPIPMHSPFL